MNDQILASSRVLVKWSAMSPMILMFSIFLPLCWPYLPLELQGAVAATSALYRQYCFQEKKKKWGGGERISFASLIGEKNILQKNLRRLPMNFHGQDWGICSPSVVRKAVLQGSHTFSLFSGRWALPANKGMGNACRKAANHIHLYSDAPSVPGVTTPGGHWAPKCPAESQDLSSTFGQVLTKWELGVSGEGQKPFHCLFCHLNSGAFIKVAFSPSCS